MQSVTAQWERKWEGGEICCNLLFPLKGGKGQEAKLRPQVDADSGHLSL